METESVLYSFRRCPFAMRARLALAISETTYELREVHLARKPAAMLAASPKGTVPVLVSANGTVIDESLDIMRWALSRNDPEGWLDREGAELIALNDGEFKYALDRYKYPERYGSSPEKHRALGLAFVVMLDGRLAASKHLCGPQRGLADAAIAPFVRQFAAVDPQWFAEQTAPHLQAWLAAYVGSPLFEAIMMRAAPWSPPEAKEIAAWRA
ncbi:glutathione S-transferase [Tsuneonella sp. HG249]